MLSWMQGGDLKDSTSTFNNTETEFHWCYISICPKVFSCPFSQCAVLTWLRGILTMSMYNRIIIHVLQAVSSCLPSYMLLFQVWIITFACITLWLWLHVDGEWVLPAISKDMRVNGCLRELTWGLNDLVDFWSQKMLLVHASICYRLS